MGNFRDPREVELEIKLRSEALVKLVFLITVLLVLSMCVDSYVSGKARAAEPRQSAPQLGPQASWEWVSKELGLRRTRTPQGWLVQDRGHSDLIYIPDPNYEWLTVKPEAE